MIKTFWAFSIFLPSPNHVFTTESYNALPNEKLKCHIFPSSKLFLLIQCKLFVAYNSLYPPDKKNTPPKSAGKVDLKTDNVFSATF